MRRLGFGVREVEVRKANESAGMFQGAGVAGAEVILALVAAIIFGPPLMFFIGLIIYKMWPFWDEVVGGIILTSLLIGSFIWVVAMGRLRYQERTAQVQAVRNQGRLLHGTDQGFGYVDDEGNVFGYSHAVGSGTQYEQLPERIAEVNDKVERKVEWPSTFADLLKEGYIYPGAPFIIGFPTGEDDNGPVELPELTSLGIGGGQGTGKTVDTFSLMLQGIAKYNGRIRFLVIDPHMFAATDQSLSSKVGSLHPFFLNYDGLHNPVAGGAELEEWVRVVREEMRARKAGERGQKPDMWVLVIDEFAEVAESENGDGVIDLVRQINQQARKLSMFAIIASPDWTAKTLGGTEIRHSVVSFIMHNMPTDVSDLILPSAGARQTPTLERGEVIFWTRGTLRRCKVPLATARDAEELMPHYESRSYVDAAEKTVALVPPMPTTDGLDVEESKKAAARKLILDGLSDSAIAKQLTGKSQLRNGALAEQVAWISRVRREMREVYG